MEVRNGTVNGWQTGIFSGSGGSRAIGVRAVDNTWGIILSNDALIKDCTASPGSTTTGYGLGVVSGTISGCTVKGADTYGIYLGNGIISDNVVSSTGTHSSRMGISVFDPGSLIKGNKVSGCGVGINSNSSYGYGLNVIGNTVDAASGATGFYLTDDYSNLLDQNTVTGAGTHYNAAYTKVQRRSNY